MNRGPDQLFDTRIADWLEADPDSAPDQALEVVLAAIPSIRQRRRGLFGLGGWRNNQMATSLKFAVGAAGALVVAAGGLYLLAPRDAPDVGGPVATPTPSASPSVGGPGATPTPSTSSSVSPSPSPSATATPTIDPATWVPYTSERYGYTLDHPADWTITPSQLDWNTGVIHSELSQWPDEISDPQGGITARGYSIYAARQDLETGQTPESWTAQYISSKARDAGGVCGDISTDRYEPVEIEGESGQRIEMVCVGTTFYTAAIVVHDGSAYLLALATVADSDNAPAVELFDAVLASFRFARDTAAAGTYTSARYGFSMEHPSGWLVNPADTDWPLDIVHGIGSQWVDELDDPNSGADMFAARQALEPDTTADQWLNRYIDLKQADAGGVCGNMSPGAYQPVDIQGEEGRQITTVCGSGSSANYYAAALVVHDGSAYLISYARAGGEEPGDDEAFARLVESFAFPAE